MKKDNITSVLTKFVKGLKYPISIETIYEELLIHPDYPSLLAISDVLTNFNIENSAYEVGLDNLENLPCPLIVNTRLNKDDFLLVNKIENQKVTVSSEKWNKHKMSFEEFRKTFKGAVLTAEISKNKSKFSTVKNFINQSKSSLVLMGMLAILFTTLILNVSDFFIINLRTVSILLIISLGVFVSILLLIQSIGNNNSFVQKLCKIGAQTNCNDILTSKAAKVFEGLTWSEVGFFYFTGTLLFFLLGHLTIVTLQILALLNVVSLPYTVYSIYYQGKVAKQWCILCCTIQVLLWFEFIPLSAAFNQPFHMPGYSEFTSLFMAFLLPITSWLILKPVLFKAQQLHPLKQQLQKFKYNTELFNNQLITQPNCVQPDTEWSIILGSNEAEYTITMATNPYCPPCAKTHEQLHQLLEQCPNVQARIVFTTDNSDDDIRTPISRHLMALNSLNDRQIVKGALKEWYENKSYENWAKNYPADLQKEAIEQLDKQKAWCTMAKVTETPTMLLNGYRIPNSYQLSDLKYMLQ